MAKMAVVKLQLRRLSLGGSPDPQVPPLRALLLQQLAMARRPRWYRRRMAG